MEAAEGVVDEPLEEAASPTPPTAAPAAEEDPPEAWTNLMWSANWSGDKNVAAH